MTSSRSRIAFEKDSAKGKRFGIVVSRYHEEITKELLKGAEGALEDLGAAKEDIYTVWVPGAFEIPLAARALVGKEYDAVICLGVIVKGETMHDHYIAREVARGIAAVSLGANVPVVFGVLTVQTIEQAQARTGKGSEAAETAVEMIHTLEKIKKSGKKIDKSVGFASGL